MNQPKVKYSLSNWDLVTVNPNYKTWNWKDLFCFWGSKHPKYYRIFFNCIIIHYV